MAKRKPEKKPSPLFEQIREKAEANGVDDERLAELLGCSQERMRHVQEGRAVLSHPGIVGYQELAQAIHWDVIDLIKAINSHRADGPPNPLRVAPKRPTEGDKIDR